MNFIISYEIGFMDEDQHYSGYSMSELAILLNNGDKKSNLPARPFLETWFQRFESSFHNRKFKREQDFLLFLQKEKLVLQEIMCSNSFAPLSEKWVNMKGFDYQFRHHYDLIESIKINVTKINAETGKIIYNKYI